MTTDDDLIGYLFDVLDPDDRAAIDGRLAAEAALAARLESLRDAAAPLDADRADPEPPAGLALRTVARMAEYLVANEPRTPSHPAAEPARYPASPVDRPEFRGVGGRFRADLLVASVLVVFVVGLGLTAVGRLRHASGEVACPNNLRTLHVGLSTYADTNGDQFPKVGPDQTVGVFVTDAGRSLPPGFTPACPADRAGAEPADATTSRTYTYSLGYRGPGGELVGLRRNPADGQNDLIPIAADNPAPNAAPCCGPVSPHARGQNVLYVGGNVRFTTTAQAGPDGDHIYQNRNGLVAAGLDRSDSVLGRAGDRP
jgi:hypothetical protein